MRLVWCAFTGALMLLSVLVTHQQRTAAEDPPGVVTRWWDGTLQSQDETWPNGKPASHTEYGEDGKTILLQQQWTPEGVLSREFKRLKSGQAEERVWDRSGKILRLYRLWLGDQSTYIIERVYHANGLMQREETKTEDGMLVNSRSSWNAAGVIENEYHIMPNASHETKQYMDGKIFTKRTDFGSGDWEELNYFPNGNVRQRMYFTKLTGKLTEESFNEDGTPALKGPNQLRGD